MTNDKYLDVLGIFAHPDDLETQCGGAVFLLAQQGVTIFSVNCTLGDLGSHDPSYHRPGLATARLAETEAAAVATECLPWPEVSSMAVR